MPADACSTLTSERRRANRNSQPKPRLPTASLGKLPWSRQYIVTGTNSCARTPSSVPANDSGATPTYDADDGDVIPLTLGANTITVTCTDGAGNEGSDSVTVTRNSPPDTTDPVVTITAPVDGSTTTAATMRMSEARNWEEFTAALRDFVVPSQNFVYADVAGHIGYYAPGRIPIRARGDGAMPSAGWTGDSEWIGWVPFDDLPHAFDPPGHAIVTANQRPMPADYPYSLGIDWPEPYRAQRITDLLRANPRLTPDTFSAMQADRLSLHAQTVLPVLLERAHPESPADTQAVDLLRQWNRDARGDSAAAAIFEAWFLHLAPALLTDDLGVATTASYEGRFSFVTRFLLNTLRPESFAADLSESKPPSGRPTPSPVEPGSRRSTATTDGGESERGTAGRAPERW